METGEDLLILDCQDFESTLLSISNITRIDKNKIADVLSNLPIDRYYTIDDIWNELIEHSADSNYKYHRTIWFHASRVIDHKSYLNRGILPLDTIQQELIDFLHSLNNKIDENYSEPLKDFDTCSQLGAKLMIQQGGPYANLVRDTFFQNDNGNYDFLKLPEILFDIIHCNQEFKTRANKLTELYLEETKSNIVKFYDLENDYYYLKTACLYLFRKINNLDLIDSANTCFDGAGQIIPPNRIIDVEILENN